MSTNHRYNIELNEESGRVDAHYLPSGGLRTAPECVEVAQRAMAKDKRYRSATILHSRDVVGTIDGTTIFVSTSVIATVLSGDSRSADVILGEAEYRDVTRIHVCDCGQRHPAPHIKGGLLHLSTEDFRSAFAYGGTPDGYKTKLASGARVCVRRFRLTGNDRYFDGRVVILWPGSV